MNCSARNHDLQQTVSEQTEASRIRSTSRQQPPGGLFRLAPRSIAAVFILTSSSASWRGGTPVGIRIRSYFEFAGVETDHIAVRTSAYVGIGQRSKTVRVHGLHSSSRRPTADNSLLIVDDVSTPVRAARRCA